MTKVPASTRSRRSRAPGRLSVLAWAVIACSALLAACGGQDRALGPSIPVGGSWTQPGGNGSHAAWGAPGPRSPLEERWHASGSGFGSAPILVGGRIVMAFDRGRDVVADVVAFDGRGTRLWSYRPQGVPFAPVGLGDLIVVPVLSHGSSSLVALRASTGAVVWNSPGPTERASWLWAATDAGSVVVMSSGPSPFLAAWGADGRQTWRVALPSAVPGTQDPLRPIAVASGAVVVLTAQGLEAHELDTGKTMWSGRPAFAETAPPTILDGHVLADLGKPNLGVTGNRLVGYSLSTGKETQSHRFAGDLLWFAVDGDTIYTWEGGPGLTDYVAAYRLPGFRPLWRRALSHHLSVGVGDFLPLAGGVLIVAASGGGLQLSFHYVGPPSVKPWTKDIPNSEISQSSETGGELAGFIPTGGGVVVATQDGGLFAFAKG